MEHVGSAGLSIGGGVASRLTDCVPFDLIRDFGRRAWPSAGSATSIHDGGDSLLVPRDDRQVLLLSPPGGVAHRAVQSSDLVEGLHHATLKRLSGVSRHFLGKGRKLLDLITKHFELLACVPGRQLKEF